MKLKENVISHDKTPLNSKKSEEADLSVGVVLHEDLVFHSQSVSYHTGKCLCRILS